MPIFPLEKNFREGESFLLKPEDLRHLKRVLRIKLGEKFQVLLPNGQKAWAHLEEHKQAHEPKKIFGKVIKYLEKKSQKTLALHIAIGMIRWQRLEWLCEKLTELGVKSLSLIITQHTRSLKNEREKIQKQVKKLELISQETLKQCERSIALEINSPISLSDFLEKNKNLKAKKLALLEREANIEKLSIQAFSDAEDFLLLIGPEGGFSIEEKKQIIQKGFIAYHLGENILRSETAAIYSASLLHSK